MLGDAMQPGVSYRTTMNSVWLVYLAQAFVATIRQRSCYSTQTCLYLLSAEKGASPKRPRICVRPLTSRSLNEPHSRFHYRNHFAFELTGADCTEQRRLRDLRSAHVDQ